ncbi:hypothetical protein OGAPHI_000746 [Ogataea philodendri]|uniref:Endoplasmic reticulum transmembrane protein n=1 Tax=Ogataea philodendri TaxID=1378263 RepID=A0A9P8PGC1_9ASCO|nr:uncharacterized protein OGAPHI_000746 [Ogataea philodendri]KAH3671035.1 hypothetical protein OGAPHI_000746 [Ogataea philodendri]
MSLQMNLIFGLLVFEMALMAVLVSPLPHKVQDAAVNAAYRLLQNQQVRVGLVFGASVLAMMFIDASRTAMPYIPKEFYTGGAGSGANLPPVPPMFAGASWSEVRVRKFYAQRNMYLTGATLFLGLAVCFNIRLLKSLVKNKMLLIDAGKASDEKTGTTTVEFEELKQELKKKELDVENLKKQIKGLHTAYQQKADQQSGSGSPVSGKKDD